jgi:hypothetical protein
MVRPALLLLALAVVAGSPRPAAATSLGPLPGYTISTPDGRYLFVMLSPWRESPQSLDEVSRALREKYPASGLYPRDDPTQALWTVDWYTPRECVWMSSDATYLVVGSDWPRDLDESAWEGPGGSGVQPASARPEMSGWTVLSFHTNGRLTRTVTFREVVTYPSEFPVRVSSGRARHVRWLRSLRLDEGEMTLTAVAHDGTRTVFDLRTGELIQRMDGPVPFRWFLAIGGGACVVGFAAFLLLRRRSRRRRFAASLPGNDEPGPSGAGVAA